MQDQLFMQRALDLARQGLGSVSPNPMVGCVIVHEGKIIGEGWHRQFGGPHAEVNAVNAVADKQLLGKATFYVTLEPCSYHGKTPACTDLILKYKPERVVVASKDPNPRVSGQGLSLLAAAGINVDFGLMEAAAVALNKRFFVNMQLQRPYVVLKWAQTADGFIARKNYDSKWISNEYSRQLVHKWRTEEDAILVGYNTVKYDNPRLTARDWQGRQPVKVIIDPRLELKSDYRVFSEEGRLFVFNLLESSANYRVARVRVSKENLIGDLLDYLYQQNVGSVLVEGGTKTLQQFVTANAWDEARVFTAPVTFAEGIKAPVVGLEPLVEKDIAGDSLQITYNPETKILWQKN